MSNSQTLVNTDNQQKSRVDFSSFRYVYWPVLVMLLLLAAFVGLVAGRYNISYPEVFSILYRGVLGLGSGSIQELVVLNVRLPRILLAGITGAGLAISGVALQTLFRNPLVSPKVLGLSSGSALGGTLAILIGISGPMLMGATFITAFGALFLVVFISNVAGRTLMTIVLAGIVIDALFAAGVSLVQFVADPEDSLPAIVFWLMGSFATASWNKVALTSIPLIVGIFLLNQMRFRIAVLAMGDDEAQAFGIKVKQSRLMVFGLVSLVIGTCVTASGVVGWVGLVIPHMARLLVGEDQFKLYPTTIILGATFMIFIDTLARSLVAAEIPLGVLTALIGAPVFVYLLCTRKRRGW
ncbi:Probable ABC transporter permease protein HI_1471 [Oligella ureolytica]|nr:iron ABC transporter permease [Oligella ureolytica]SUA52438.1 Probable ABC transporter permease protein HI_1471 [Oligella ureolytica]SUA57188.1 Probable ABC transporter permease protein HI_1471 [Oligella ureolytica]